MKTKTTTNKIRNFVWIVGGIIIMAFGVVATTTISDSSIITTGSLSITDNSFSQVENLNRSSQFTIQNLNDSTNGTAGISAFNDVGESVFVGIGSSNFILGNIDYSKATGLFSKATGKMIFANFFNQPFIWLSNPTNDNNPNNLIQSMRLDGTGLNITGNVTGVNVFQPQFLFTHSNENVSLLGAGVWANITFTEMDADIKNGIEHNATGSTNHTFTINESGIYDISYDFDVVDTSPGASDIDVAARLTYLNGTEIAGSVFETDITKQGIEVELSHEFLAKLFSGDKIKFQFIAGDEDVEISDHASFGDNPESASVVMKKISNII